MSITSRLGLAFLVMIALTLGVGALGLARMHQLSETTRSIAVERFGKVQLAERAVALINDNSRVALHLFLVADPAEFDRQLAEQRKTSAEITEIYEQFERQIDSDEERARFDDVLRARSRYVGQRERAEKLLRAADAPGARAVFEQDVLPELEAYILAWNAELALEGRRMEAAASDAAAAYQRARTVTVTLVLVVGAIGLIFAAVAVRRITRPILAVTQAARLLEKGERAPLVRVESNDEVGVLARAFNLMGEAVAFRHERLQREMTLAQQIQTAILPRRPRAASLDLSASMKPAAEVGGDYYDVLPVKDGCWIGMGDVAGHGLDAGLVMLMIQAGVAALVGKDPNIAPREAVTTINRVLYENLNERLGKTSHATMVLLRIRDDGRVVFAGAHEELVVYRAHTRRCEIIETPGGWVGGVSDIASVTTDTILELEEGDTLVLFTDGVTEAKNEAGVMFGVERLCEELQRVCDKPVDDVRKSVFDAVAAWSTRIDDDMSVVVARRKNRPSAEKAVEE
jgi:serine phosphatase RsbU (regulator of sigma subunit)/CHASE3 domain sensor protein